MQTLGDCLQWAESGYSECGIVARLGFGDARPGSSPQPLLFARNLGRCSRQRVAQARDVDVDGAHFDPPEEQRGRGEACERYSNCEWVFYSSKGAGMGGNDATIFPSWSSTMGLIRAAARSPTSGKM